MFLHRSKSSPRIFSRKKRMPSVRDWPQRKCSTHSSKFAVGKMQMSPRVCLLSSSLHRKQHQIALFPISIIFDKRNCEFGHWFCAKQDKLVFSWCSSDTALFWLGLLLLCLNFCSSIVVFWHYCFSLQVQRKLGKSLCISRPETHAREPPQSWSENHK